MKYLTQILLISASLLFSTAKTFSQTWTQKQDIPNTPTSGRWGAYCFTIGNKIYAGGGYIGNFNNLHDLWEYNPITDSWTQKASVPGSSSRTSAVSFSINGKGYVGLGQQDFNNTNSTFLSDVWEYDPLLDSWTEKASLPDSARSNASCFVINNQAYIVGGITDYPTTASNDLWMYDPSTNLWTTKQSYPADYIYSSMSFAIGSNGYTVGGRVKLPTSAIGVTSKATWQYNPTNNNWAAKADYCDTLGRESGVAFVLNNKAFVGLGMSKLPTVTYYYKEFCVYDTTDVWSPTVSFSGIDRAYSIAATVNNKAYVGAGFLYNGSQNYYRDWYEFDTSSTGNFEVLDFDNITIYPNPVNDNLHIDFKKDASEKDIKITIRDISGRIVVNNIYPIDNQYFDVNTSSMIPGIYFLNIIGDSFHLSKKFIKVEM